MTDAVLATSGMRQPAPILQPDLRPVADVASLVRDATPQVPLPIPPGSSQTAVVAETRMASRATLIDNDRPPERVLKPYGISMLPETFEENKVELDTEDEDPEAATNSTEGTEDSAMEAAPEIDDDGQAPNRTDATPEPEPETQ